MIKLYSKINCGLAPYDHGKERNVCVTDCNCMSEFPRLVQSLLVLVHSSHKLYIILDCFVF